MFPFPIPLIISDAALGIFFLRPIAALLTAAAIAAVVVPLVRAILAASRRRRLASGSASV